MNAQEFLELLLPPSGVIFTATQAGKGWANTSHTSIKSAVQHVNTLTFNNQQAYFALATYEKDKVWDPSWKNSAGVVEGKWRTRTQANAQYLKTFFLDLDVDAGDESKFPDKSTAIAELKAFVKKIGLPRPMLVDSGGGIHAYWPLVNAVLTTEWRPVADKFKAICLQEKFKADRSLTSDQARVLRCLGGFNFRRGAPVKLLSGPSGPHPFSLFEDCFGRYIDDNNIGATAAPRAIAGAIPGNPSVGRQLADGFGDNLGVTNDPIHFDRITFACAQLGAQVAVRGAGIGEQLWRAGLGIAKFADPQAPALAAISDGHAEYDSHATATKADNWRTGPATCAMFHQSNPATCEACPHWQGITSPAQLGRTLREAAPAIVALVDDTGAIEVIEVPPPPKSYIRGKDGKVSMVTEDKEGTPVYEEVCPYDLYPIKILRQNGEDMQVDERSIWRAHLPRIGAVDMDISQAMISDTKRLYAHLLSKGVYMSVDNSKATQLYMSAYLQVLAAQADREKLYERLGWHEDHTAFVLGDRTLHRDGSSQAHNPSRGIQAVTKGGVTTGGTLDGWKQAMKFYNRPGYEGHRFFIYAALGAPLFHMNDTGNKGVLMTASGDSGRGKTTCLRACASLWGIPEHLILNGNKDGSTINALYETLGTYHSLPFLWDDITERDPEEIRRFLLNISQGRGKERMKGNEHSGRAVSWETIVLASANTDDVSRIMSSGKDVDPHLMRLVGVEFKAIDTGVEAKIGADNFLRQINQNYGHVGPVMMKFVTMHYEKVAKGFIKNVAMVDRLLNSSNASAERYWSATVAAAYTGAQIACSLGLLDYPYENDLKWMVEHLVQQRTSIREGSATPQDILAEFLENHISNTLILSAKASSNLDCVVARPYNALLVRHELDTNVIFLSRTAMMEYCTEVKTSFRKLEQALEAAGIIVARNLQKVLGADTAYAKGQLRVWKIDASKLSGVATAPALQAVQQAKVVAIGGKAA